MENKKNLYVIVSLKKKERKEHVQDFDIVLCVFLYDMTVHWYARVSLKSRVLYETAICAKIKRTWNFPSYAYVVDQPRRV